MSLINDALKKAARQRAEELSDVVPPMPGGGRRSDPGHKGPLKTQTMILIGAAALALIVVSAVTTGILMAGKTEVKAPVAAAPKPVTPAPEPPAKVAVSAPSIVVPTIQPSVPTPTAAPAVVAKVIPSPTPIPVAVAKVETPAPTASEPQSHNEIIQGIVDRYRISGVRAAGPDSKALVDGHVYKVNEIIDRSIGLKIVKVEEGQLTFVDRDGAIYIRTF